MKFLSYYLLMSIGFKGGVALSDATWNLQMLNTFVVGIAASILVPVWMFFLLKRKLKVDDAAAIGACYGSVSAVTFLTAVSFLENHGFAFSGHFVALMALMEGPAIIMGLILFHYHSGAKKEKIHLGKILHDAFFNGSIFLLLGSMFIGFIMNPVLATDYKTFVYDIFKGFLCFFLLDLGMTAAKQLREFKKDALFFTLLGIAAPLLNASVGLGLSKLIGLDGPDALLLMILLGSASYIAVPAALRSNIPDAQPSIYLSMALGVTFPFNVLIAIPLYWKVIGWLIPS